MGNSNVISQRGVTLLELLIIMMILSLMLAAAVKAWDVTLERGRFQTTTAKLRALRTAIAGDENNVVAGHRVDFGFVGDVGQLPRNLRELAAQPDWVSRESSNWRGPYVTATFRESPDGYLLDGWGDTIYYSPDSTLLRSYGGSRTEPARWMVTEIDHTPAELERNVVSVITEDARGLPPQDTLFIPYWGQRLLLGGTSLTYPDSLGRPVPHSPDSIGDWPDGIWKVWWDSVPQGTWPLAVGYYRGPDTIRVRADVTVFPRLGAQGTTVRLADIEDWSVEPPE